SSWRPGLLVYFPPGNSQGPAASQQFMHQWKFECHFSNAMGTEHGCYLERYFYEWAEFARFNSNWYWNTHEILTVKQNVVDTFCRHKYAMAATGYVVGRRGNSSPSACWSSAA
uniref:MHC class II beta chain N-terminal domain-containing protein n=1 Tax=Varanus komodoensis TaxID=61221 RepID=A0A8D2LDB2_VARKO